MAEERVSKTEDRAIEIIHSEKRSEKKLDKLLWQYQAELASMLSEPRREKRENGAEKNNCPCSSLFTWVLPSCKYPRNMTLSHSIDRYSCVYNPIW